MIEYNRERERGGGERNEKKDVELKIRDVHVVSQKDEIK